MATLHHSSTNDEKQLLPKDFTENPSVREIMQELHKHLKAQPNWRVSDISGGEVWKVKMQDQEYTYPLRYVDLVMEGGGMLGIALVGYVYALEQVGIRFLNIGGTSAGSINALLMAVAGPREQASTEWIIRHLANKNFYDFVDGDEDARDFTADLLRPNVSGRGIWGWLKKHTDKFDLFTDGLQIIDSIRDQYGLHKGDAFKAWLNQLLQEKNVMTIEQLINLRKIVPTSGLKLTHDADNRVLNGSYEAKNLARIAIVAADITTQTKVVFPEMAPLYWKDWEGLSPAELVRASMSIPLFFQPYIRHSLPGSEDQAQEYKDAWNALDYTGAIPKSVLFMDGGIMSNFPIDLFHDNTRVPAAPTFGIKLGIDRAKPRPNKTLPNVLEAMFDAARTQYDFDFIHRNSDYRHLVQCLNVDRFNWLDFRMSRQNKIALFIVGVRGAVEFLKKFNWEEYKKLRAAKIEVAKQSTEMDQAEARLKESKVSPLKWPGDLIPPYMKNLRMPDKNESEDKA